MSTESPYFLLRHFKSGGTSPRSRRGTGVAVRMGRHEGTWGSAGDSPGDGKREGAK